MKLANRNQQLMLLAGALLFTGSAWSLPPLSDPMVTRSVSVKYNAALAATAEGASALYGKLRAAASLVCSNPYDSMRHMDGHGSYAACVSDALDRAVQDVGSPTLAALHQPQATEPAASLARR
jgi:UrcA family protein